MNQLQIIPHGAILIRNGLIDATGTSRRIENLAIARMAHEIDATGKIVLPAFVDPDVSLTSPGRMADGASETDIRRMSRRRVEGRAATVAADLASFGALTIGANTRSAPDGQNAIKALLTHRLLKSNPLRVRSIFSLPTGQTTDSATHGLVSVFRRELASLLELDVTNQSMHFARAMAGAASETGYATRFRLAGVPSAAILDLACFAGAVALLCEFPDCSPASRRLADMGCVQVFSATQMLKGEFANARAAIADGAALALASGFHSDGSVSLNPQVRMQLAGQHLGMSAEEGIVAATYNAACALRFSHQTGSIEPGKSADICIFDVDDYRELSRSGGDQRPDLAMRAGKVVWRPTPDPGIN